MMKPLNLKSHLRGHVSSWYGGMFLGREKRHVSKRCLFFSDSQGWGVPSPFLSDLEARGDSAPEDHGCESRNSLKTLHLLLPPDYM